MIDSITPVHSIRLKHVSPEADSTTDISTANNFESRAYFRSLMLTVAVAFWIFAILVSMADNSILLHLAVSVGVGLAFHLVSDRLPGKGSSFIRENIPVVAFYCTTVISGFLVIRPWLFS